MTTSDTSFPFSYLQIGNLRIVKTHFKGAKSVKSGYFRSKTRYLCCDDCLQGGAPAHCYRSVNYAGNGPHLQRTCPDIH